MGGIHLKIPKTKHVSSSRQIWGKRFGSKRKMEVLDSEKSQQDPSVTTALRAHTEALGAGTNPHSCSQTVAKAATCHLVGILALSVCVCDQILLFLTQVSWGTKQTLSERCNPAFHRFLTLGNQLAYGVTMEGGRKKERERE